MAGSLCFRFEPHRETLSSTQSFSEAILFVAAKIFCGETTIISQEETVLSVRLNTFWGTDKVLFATENVFSAEQIIVGAAEKSLVVPQSTLSGTNKIISTTEKIFSGAEMMASADDPYKQ